MWGRIGSLLFVFFSSRKLQLSGRPILPEPKRGLPLGAELFANNVDRGHLLGVLLDGRRFGAGPDHVRGDDPAGRGIAIFGYDVL